MLFSRYTPVRSLSNFLKASALTALLTAPVYFAQAQGSTLNIDFSKQLALSNTEIPGAWYTDRYPPCGFASQAQPPKGNGSALEEDICQNSSSGSGDYHTPAPSFFNTQGRKLDLGPYAISTSINLYVSPDWAGSPRRFAGVWDAFTNSAGVVGNDYGIIEFQGATPAGSIQGPGAYPNSTTAHPEGLAGFYGFDSTANNGDGGYVYMGLPDGFKYGDWVTLTVSYTPGSSSINYTVTDGKYSSIASVPLYDTTEVAIANTILEGYNYNINYSIYWEKFSYYTISASCKNSK